MRTWPGWSLYLLGVLLLPVVCMAHGLAVVWLYEKAYDTHILLQALSLIVLVLLGVVAILLGMAAMGLWVGADREHGALVALMVLALCGLIAGYFGTLRGVEPWVLQWRGVETTCTIRDVFSPGAPGTPVPLGISTYHLECAAPAAPDELRSMSLVGEPGERIQVVYDPRGDAGAHGESQVDDARTWAWVTGIGMAVWTVLTMARACLEIPLARDRATRRSA